MFLGSIIYILGAPLVTGALPYHVLLGFTAQVTNLRSPHFAV